MSRPLQPMIVVPEEACGPAMAAISPAQRAFVMAKVHFGCNNAEAARRAGYSRNQPADAKVTAYRLAHNDGVQAAIIEESRKLMAGEGPRSIRTLVAIRDDRSKEAKDRIKAAVELLNRGGLQAVSEHHLTVEHHMTDAQKDQRILALCNELGLPEAAARKMLIAPEVLDAEFEEVPEPTPEQAERAERYQRINEGEKQAARRAMSPEEREAHKAATREAHAASMKLRYAEAQQSREGIEDLLPDMESPDAP
jgi:hypothetical protein